MRAARPKISEIFGRAALAILYIDYSSGFTCELIGCRNDCSEERVDEG